jgi:hypothetical protein
MTEDLEGSKCGNYAEDIPDHSVVQMLTKAPSESKNTCLQASIHLETASSPIPSHPMQEGMVIACRGENQMARMGIIIDSSDAKTGDAELYGGTV